MMIVGCCGAGKSTLSRKLGELLSIELIHLDQLFWNPNWVKTPPPEWATKVETVAAKENWIIDGNYGGTMDIRIKRATHIVLLDFPRWLCMYRVVKRILKNHGQVRPDMPAGCRERFDLEFLHYVYHYKRTRVPGIQKKINVVKESKKVYVLYNDHEVADFIQNFSPSN